MEAIGRRTRKLSKQEVRLVRSRLLPTWQSGAGIAMHAGLPAKTVLAALKRYANEWGVETKLIYLDGHNQVHMFRARQRVLVMGVSFPMDADELEEA